MNFTKEKFNAMKLALIVTVAAGCAFAQGPPDVFFQAPVQAGAIAFGVAGGPPGVAVTGAPYSATISNESVQTLADGTHITQGSSGSAARDSQGRTRQDTPLPAIGIAIPKDAPHLVMIQDPVGGVAYTLNLTDKTAWKHAMPSVKSGVVTNEITTRTVVVRAADPQITPPPPPGAPPPGMNMMWQQKHLAEHAGEVATEDLGTQVIEGVQATGVRTTETIAAGKIGNDRAISIVTEVWTSPELKTVVLSKRNDPRTGEQTFKLTNIQRSEPDPSLFTVPSDFKLNENGAETIVYRTNRQ
jgi:hypothetical protein